MSLRYEGVRFGDGSVAVRRIASDPCDRATLTFESVRELEEDVGSADVTWIADRGSTKPPAAPSRSRPPVPGEIDAYFAREHARATQDSDSESIRPDIGSGPNPQSALAPCVEKQGPASAELSAIRRHDEFAIPMRPAYAGDGHPALRAPRYEPTEEIDEP